MSGNGHKIEWRTIKQIFEPREIYFTIPLYQRQAYCWREDNIKKLFESIKLNLTEDNPQITFLGTLLLLEKRADQVQENQDQENRRQLEVIDGQQRLITLMLIIKHLSEYVDEIQRKTIDEEEGDDKVKTFKKDNGQLYGSYKEVSRDLDRIVSEDNSIFLCDGYDDFKKKKHSSAIAQYLYTSLKDSDLEKILKDPDERGSEELYEATKIIKEEVEGIISEVIKTPEEGEIASVEKFRSSVRLAEYLLNSITFIDFPIKQDNASIAFDIFDSLNTTGVSLTAIDTLRARVYNHLGSNKYIKSEERKYFDSIQKSIEVIIKKSKKPSPLQLDTAKEIISASEYYLHGWDSIQKRFGSLVFSYQNQWLASEYEKRKADSQKKEMLKDIRDIAEYRGLSWYGDLGNWKDGKDEEKRIAQICLRAIEKNGTHLSIPILAYFFYQNKDDFYEAVKSFTSFLFLRRFQRTHGTTNIDGVFKELSKIIVHDHKNKGRKYKASELKKFFIKKIKEVEFDKEKIWVETVEKDDSGGKSALGGAELFLRIYYANQKEGEQELTKEISEQGKAYKSRLANQMNTGEITLEHIAPKKGTHWGNSKLYTENGEPRKGDEGFAGVYSIGNLTLLPKKRNSAIGNREWGIKKIYYKALAADSGEQVSEILEQEKSTLGEDYKNIERMVNNTRSDGTIRTVNIYHLEDWGEEQIKKRRKRILKTTWKIFYQDWLNTK